MYKIKSVVGREILDSRGNPTVGVEIELDDGIIGSASVPSGASTGSREALELRDSDPNRFNGKGVLKAVENINNKIAKILIDKDSRNQKELDELMIELDGSEEKKYLGANAILGVSLAVLSASSKAEGLEIYEKIAELSDEKKPSLLPVPMLNIMNGGAHAINSTDFQEFMIAPMGFDSFGESIRAGSEIYFTLGKILENEGLSTNVGYEGGYAPSNLSNKQVLDFIITATEKAGYMPGDDIFISLDPASSEFGNKSEYFLSKENMKLSSDEMVEYYSNLIEEYPIYSIEDGLSEDDWNGWNVFTNKHGKKTQIVGDDLFVTQKKYLEKGISEKSANAILIKFNQVGTISETLETIQLASNNNIKSVISHRSGETEDTTIADLAVGTNSGQIKTGAPARSDRVAKYNRLLRIEEKHKDKATFAGKSILL